MSTILHTLRFPTGKYLLREGEYHSVMADVNILESVASFEQRAASITYKLNHFAFVWLSIL